MRFSVVLGVLICFTLVSFCVEAKIKGKKSESTESSESNVLSLSSESKESKPAPKKYKNRPRPKVSKSQSSDSDEKPRKSKSKGKGRSMSSNGSKGKQQGRGVLSNFVKIHTDLVNDFLSGDPVGALKHLFQNVGGVASDAYLKFGEFSNVLQTALKNLAADEINDLVHAVDKPMTYRLYTQKNKIDGELMQKDGTVFNTHWDKEAKVKVMIHGFSMDYILGKNSSENMMGQLKIKDAYLAAGSRDNLIVADWTSMSRTISYIRAAAATRIAGADLAKFLYELLKAGNIENAEDIHLIGFSLGGHVSGVAGHVFQNYTEGDRIGRITGLDPAGPLFDEIALYPSLPIDARYFLDKSDASFVDIMHCNLGRLSAGVKLGLITKAGHCDFYVNGGIVQPGCEIIGGAIQKLVCSHSRCWELFSASVAQTTYPACRCESYEVIAKEGKCKPCIVKHPKIYMGDLLQPKTKGVFYVDAPFNESHIDFKFD